MYLRADPSQFYAFGNFEKNLLRYLKKFQRYIDIRKWCQFDFKFSRFEDISCLLNNLAYSAKTGGSAVNLRPDWSFQHQIHIIFTSPYGRHYLILQLLYIFILERAFLNYYFLIVSIFLGDKPRNLLKYNSEIGIQVVMDSEEKKCKCHGLSGNFPSFSKLNKKTYHNVLLLIINTFLLPNVKAALHIFQDPVP